MKPTDHPSPSQAPGRMVHAKRAVRVACGILRRLITVRNFLALLLLATPALAEEPQVHRDIPFAEPKTSVRRLMSTLPKRARATRSSSGFMVAAGNQATRLTCR